MSGSETWVKFTSDGTLTLTAVSATTNSNFFMLM